MVKNSEKWALLAVLAAIGCGQTAPQEAEDEEAPAAMELRTYDVPGGQSDAVRAALSRVFDAPEGETPPARASVTPDGLLLVLGPPGVQEGVNALVERVGEGGTEQTRAIIATEVWVVAGVPGESGEIPPALSQISDALATVERHEGPHRFLPLEKLSVRVQENEPGRVEGAVELGEFASLVGDRIMGDFSISGLGSHINTKLAIQPGQVVILGTSSVGVDHLAGNVDPAALGDVPRVGMFYVVRCSVERPGGSE